MAALMGKKKGNPQSVLHGPSSPVRLTHTIEGRTRFHVQAIKNANMKCEQLVQQLCRIEGVSNVSADHRTGSIVIMHDRLKLKSDLLAAAIIRILGLEQQLQKSPQPKVIKESRRLGNALNSAVYDKTGGFIDLWSLVPLVIIGLGIRKIATDRSNMLPTGVTLLWWGYNSLFGGGKAGQ
jgi:hypothetical protein